MNKIIIALAVSAVLFIAGCATTEITESPAAGDKMTEEKVEVPEPEKTDNGQEKTRVSKMIFIPYTVRETSLYSDGFIESYKVFTYDEDMNLVREDLFDSFDEVIESQVYTEASGGIIERRLYNERGQLQSWSRIRNNADFQPVRIEFMDSESELQTVSEYEYDGRGNKTEWSVYNGDGAVLSRTEYLYEGDLNTKIELFDAAGELKEYFILEYEEDSLAGRTHYDEDKRIKASTEYTFDDAGHLTEVNFLRANGSVQREVHYTNDERGNPVKIENYDGEGVLMDLVEREYEYKTKEIFVWE